MKLRQIEKPRREASLRYPHLVLLLLGAAVFASPERAIAQAGEARVRALTQEATEAYTNLDLDRADSVLTRALAEARRRRVRGRALAEVHVLRGVVAIGGQHDVERGAAAFAEALEADPTVQVDRMVSNPEIESVFRESQQRAGITPPGDRRIPHTPVTEQLVRTPLPIYVEVPAGISAHHLVVRYWPLGQDETYDEAALEPVGQGYGVELPCIASTVAGIEYYVVVLGADGQVIAQAGSEEEPFSVRVVAERTTEAPALPTRRPPEQCPEACPPGATCGETQDLPAGGACATDSDCADGLACEDRVCAEPRQRSSAERPRFFLRGGYTAGFGYARPGGRADTGIPPGVDPNDPNAIYPYQGYTVGDPTAPNGDIACNEPAGVYCVRVQTEGLVFVHGLTGQVGYVVLPRLALVAGGRVALSGGEGTLSHLLLTAGIELRIIEPEPTGLLLTVAGQGGIGQIQLRVPQGGGGIYEPFIVTGLGNMNISAVLGYRFHENLGVIVVPTLHGFFPDRTFVFEATVGGEIVF